MPDKRFQTILFDADGTLFDFKKAERVAVTSTASEFNIIISEWQAKLFSEINELFWRKLEAGEITREKLYTERFTQWFKEIGISADSESFGSAYIINLSKCGFLFDGVVELLDALKDSYNLYVVTNGNSKTQRSRFAHSGIMHYFKKIYISEEIGYKKPDKEFFEFVFFDMNSSDTSKIIILGDSLTSDMQGGKNARITTCKYSPDGKLNYSHLCDYEVETYDEFLDLLNNHM